MQDRAISNLNDAFRNIPSITIGAGEFKSLGTSPTIRGFVARTDMFIDGQRDIGDYYRDPFDLEQVQVLEGPASTLFGRGSTGGVINQVTKKPQLARFRVRDADRRHRPHPPRHRGCQRTAARTGTGRRLPHRRHGP